MHSKVSCKVELQQTSDKGLFPEFFRFLAQGFVRKATEMRRKRPELLSLF
jgi:hypothetical protein